MAWCRSGDKSLSEPMMVSLLTHTWVTRPHWVNNTLMPRQMAAILQETFSNSISWMTILLKRRSSRAWISIYTLQNSIRRKYYSMLYNSLAASDALRRQKTWSSLIQVMVLCRRATNHYLNQCWLICNDVLWYSPWGDLTDIPDKITATSLRNKEFK